VPTLTGHERREGGTVMRQAMGRGQWTAYAVRRTARWRWVGVGSREAPAGARPPAPYRVGALLDRYDDALPDLERAAAQLGVQVLELGSARVEAHGDA
jgi:hypothetical protein